MNLTRLRAAENPPEPHCFRRSAMRASSSASQLDVGSFVTLWPSTEYDTTGEPDSKADSTLSRIDSYSASRSDADRAITAVCGSARRSVRREFQMRGIYLPISRVTV